MTPRFALSSSAWSSCVSYPPGAWSATQWSGRPAAIIDASDWRRLGKAWLVVG